MRQIGNKEILIRRTVVLVLLISFGMLLKPHDSYAPCAPGHGCSPEGSTYPCTISGCSNAVMVCENGQWSQCKCKVCTPNQIYFGNDPSQCQQLVLQCNSTGTGYNFPPIQYGQTGCDCQPYDTLNGCYDGPPETKGISPCHAGHQTCNDGFWSACTGQVTPTPEICDGIDNNCNGTIDDVPNDPCCGNPMCDGCNMQGGGV